MKKTNSRYEKKIGLKYYQNSRGFIDGKIKIRSEDFEVKEVSNFEYERYGRGKEEEYDYLVAKVIAKNWDTNDLVREISNNLGISKKRLGFAGTKDKKAVTKQLFTFYNVKKSELDQLNIKGVKFEEYGLSNDEINIGDLVGNKFRIKIREVSNPKRARVIDDILSKNGMINYFGPQRFGKVRPISHLVGEQIVREHYEEAIKIYITKSFSKENKKITSYRRNLNKNWGSKEAYKNAIEVFPNYLRYERSMLHHLYENKKDSVGALRRLPQNLLRLFIHAYQSFLFNKSINYRLEKGYNLKKAMIGDVVCYTDLDTGIPNRHITERVDEKNKEKIQEMIDQRKAYITGPLFGKKTKMALGEMGKIEEEILEKENLELLDFEIKEIPEISSTGLRREMVIFPKFDSVKEKNNSIVIEFFLPKGTYATCVTREFRGEDFG